MTEEKNVDRRIIHGVLMAVFNRGLLIRGGSGSGKSQLALELIARGHRLVADDAVRVWRQNDELFGEPPELIAGVLAVDGIGLVDVVPVFGPEAILPITKIDLCIDLVRERTLDFFETPAETMPTVDLDGIAVPGVRLDISKWPANATVIETAVRILDRPSAKIATRLAAAHDSSIKR